MPERHRWLPTSGVVPRRMAQYSQHSFKQSLAPRASAVVLASCKVRAELAIWQCIQQFTPPPAWLHSCECLFQLPTSDLFKWRPMSAALGCGVNVRGMWPRLMVQVPSRYRTEFRFFSLLSEMMRLWRVSIHRRCTRLWMLSSGSCQILSHMLVASW